MSFSTIIRRSCVPISLLAALLLLHGCGASLSGTETGGEIVLSPDYSDVTIPWNIAPLNFRIEGPAEKYRTGFSGADGSRFIVNGSVVDIPLRRWRRLLEANKGGKIRASISGKVPGEGWKPLKELEISVAAEAIDGYVSYRLIEPTYGMAGEMRLAQRDLTSFREKDIYSNMLDYDRQGGQCVNCHSFQSWGTSNMQFHVRQKDGGTVIVHDGAIRKVNLKRGGILSAGVYPSWHPTEPLIAYSVNSTYQNFFSKGAHKTEVIDNDSDLILYDVENDEVVPVLNDPLLLETFPYWSPDGKTLFFCQASLEGIDKAAGGRITDDFDKMHYNLMRMSFDPATRTFGEPELLYDAVSDGQSATLPRLSPDGGSLVFTLGTFGNFHIWHKESDLYLMEYPSGEVRKLENVNSDDTESYHSWSSDGRWMIFSSRRDDGLYTRLYISYFDAEGHACKPFILPQKDPEHYSRLYKSYNIPEFTREEVTASPRKFLKVIRKPL